MKTAMTALAALALSASAASASWTGCRVGLTGGMTAAQTEVGASLFAGTASGSLDGLGTDGAEFGVLGGCDLQVGSRFIVGAFADWVTRDQEWSVGGSAGANSLKLSTEYGDEWAIGVRAGITVTPTTAVFLTGGYSEAKGGPITLTVNGTNVGGVDMGDFSGFFVGGQMETEVMKNIFITAEYRFHRYDTRTIDLAPTAVIDTDTDAHTARISVSYKFGGQNDTLVPTK